MEGLPAATLEHEESTSSLSESEAVSNHSNPTEIPKLSRKPRREVWWLDQDATNHSLKSIGRCFEDRLNRSLLSSSSSLLRHIRSPMNDDVGRNLHQCPGYLREEITLTCDLSKSVIVSHAFPGPSERCSICHQLVQYTYSESFDFNNIISYYQPTPNNSLSLPPTKGALAFDQFAPTGGIDPFTPIIGIGPGEMQTERTAEAKRPPLQTNIESPRVVPQALDTTQPTVPASTSQFPSTVQLPPLVTLQNFMKGLRKIEERIQVLELASALATAYSYAEEEETILQDLTKNKENLAKSKQIFRNYLSKYIIARQQAQAYSRSQLHLTPNLPQN